MQKENLFALEVDGDSMIDAMVNDGDLIIMKPTREAKNGEMVAVRLKDQNETTLKHFYHEGNRVRLTTCQSHYGSHLCGFILRPGNSRQCSAGDPANVIWDNEGTLHPPHLEPLPIWSGSFILRMKSGTLIKI